MTVAATPLSRTGKYLSAVLILLLAAMLLMGFYAFVRMPARVPTHFGPSGRPDSYGSRGTFLIVPLSFSLAPVIILLVTRFRFSLFNKRPYMLNLPAFYAYIYQIPEARRGFWINKYFELVLALGVALSLYFVVLLAGIYNGIANGGLPSWFTNAAIILPVGLIIPFLYGLQWLSGRMRKEVV